ncbi:hypothetical protein [Kribbella swartbergensis]
MVEADARGFTELAEEFAPPEPELLDALTYCDMTSGVDGNRVDVEDRINEILRRYPREHVVHRSIVRSGPDLRRAARNVQRRLGVAEA